MAFTPVQKLSIGTGTALALLALAGIVAYLSLTQMIGGQQAVAETNSNIGRLDRVIQRTADAENAQRGFVVTGDTAYIEPLNTAQSDVEYALDSLRDATEDNPDQRNNLDKLAPMVATRFREIRTIITARERAGPDSAIKLQRKEVPARARAAAGALAIHMRDEELRVLGERTRRMTDKGRAASNVILAASVFALLLALIALQPLRPSVGQRLTQQLSMPVTPTVPDLHLTSSEEARHAGDRLQRLQQVVTALNGPATGADVALALLTRGALPLVASLGVVATRAGAGFVMLRTAGDVVPQLAAGSTIPSNLVEPFAEAARSLDSLIIESRSERKLRYASLGRFSVDGTSDGAFVAVPLIADDVAHGVLLLAFADSRHFSDDERAYLATLGRLGGRAIARSMAGHAGH